MGGFGLVVLVGRTMGFLVGVEHVFLRDHARNPDVNKRQHNCGDLNAPPLMSPLTYLVISHKTRSTTNQ